ncbi:(Fe-S)-binding protein [Desulfogranum marinum]|uniref:(Fe-S)-binding protein n=1 Tax=Desulfogranum marinum TaxID=453220 RepID=UPI0029C796D2|nr:(Fe-S)-binding protein [Desulfogranum marinum]
MNLHQCDRSEAQECARCGICLEKCPVYQTTLDETVSPRSKVQLSRFVTEDKLSLSDPLNEVFSKCLMCGTCTAGCPSSLAHDLLFMKLRSALSSELGTTWPLRIIYHLLSDQKKLKFAAGVARFGRNKVLKGLFRDVDIGDYNLKQVPKLNARPFLDQMPETNTHVGDYQGTVLYFTGCATNHIFEDTGKSIVRVLTIMGYDVVIPKGQVCCALPIFIHGETDKAASNIEKNIKLFNQDDALAVLTDCATCGSALRHGYGALLKSLGRPAEEAVSLSKKVFDASEFIADHFELLAPHLNANATVQPVTYHNPCHLRNAQGVQNKVEKLIAKLPSIDFRPSVDADSCCGGGGSFAYEHPDIAGKIAAKKIQHAKETGARLWATGCPGCHLHLRLHLKPDDPLKMVHPIQLVDENL